MADNIDASLKTWNDIGGGTSWEAILVGNGASRAVWDAFKYPSLYDVATSGETEHPLAAEDQAIFGKLGHTRNFEGVLAALLTSRHVCEALALPTSKIEERYESIRLALVDAVHHVHVPWPTVPKSTLLAIRSELLNYQLVFLTNYDLLIYWSMMAELDDGFRDFFWGQQFDISNVEIWGKRTKVLYLHGGLHLYYSTEGGTFKEHAAPFANLLTLFGKRPDAVPLCITEGSPSQKLAAIARSDYLSFAYQQFGESSGPLVIFGQSFGDTDTHIADVLERDSGRIIAVGIYRQDDAQVIKQKAHFRKLLPKANLLYFDSLTHPLGDASLRIG